MHKEIKFKDLMLLFDELKKNGYSIEEIAEIPIWIGDDERLDIHPASFCKSFNEIVDKDVIDYIKHNYIKIDIEDIILIR